MDNIFALLLSAWDRRSPVTWRALGVMALAMALASQPVHAQWQVQDQPAEQSLSNINSDADSMSKVLGNLDPNNNTINTNLYNLNRQLLVPGYDQNVPGDRVADPQQALPAATTVLDDGSHCTTLAAAQQSICQQIVGIENAQYQYMLTMYATSATRDSTLRTLLNERQQITSNNGPSQFAQLEDNTNKLTALYTLIALDRQQMMSVYYAYQTNLRYLENEQTQLANAAATGNPVSSGGSGFTIPGVGNLGSLLGNLTTGLVLKGALTTVQSPIPAGMQTLSTEQSNGW